jgi:L-amino acid N-acyltransferase YncA
VPNQRRDKPDPAAAGIAFRLARPDDAAGILAVYAPFCESTCVSFEIVAPSEQQMLERIARTLPRYPWLICEADGEVAGYVYASRHRERAAYRWAVDVAVYVAARHRRRGLGRALYFSLFSILRQQGYFKAYASITLPNESSVALHQAVGFRPVGIFPGVGFKMGRWLDVGWWQFDIKPQTIDPGEPLSFEEIRSSAAVQQALVEGQRRLIPRLGT